MANLLNRTFAFWNSSNKCLYLFGAEYIKSKKIQMIIIGNRMKSCSAVLFSVILRVMFLLLAFSAHAQAPGPAWWFARGVVNTNLHPNDYAPINGGQLKWMATNAYDEMNAYFGAGSNVAAVVGAFSNSNNYYLVNIGQVKYVVQRFYDRLHELNLTNTFPANMPGSYYPWGNAPHTNDYAVANIGQVKYVFSFDSSVDSDGDGLSDWLEAKLGTDPYNPDTDGDGLPDGWEVAHGKDPLDPSDAEPEVTNMRETARQRIIYHWQLYFGTMPTFTNALGSAADLNDMKDALNALSGKFYKVE